MHPVERMLVQVAKCRGVQSARCTCGVLVLCAEGDDLQGLFDTHLENVEEGPTLVPGDLKPWYQQGGLW